MTEAQILAIIAAAQQLEQVGLVLVNGVKGIVAAIETPSMTDAEKAAVVANIEARADQRGQIRQAEIDAAAGKPLTDAEKAALGQAPIPPVAPTSSGQVG